MNEINHVFRFNISKHIGGEFVQENSLISCTFSLFPIANHVCIHSHFVIRTKTLVAPFMC